MHGEGAHKSAPGRAHGSNHLDPQSRGKESAEVKTVNATTTSAEAATLPALCTVQQAAALTGYSPHFISDSCVRGDIKAVKFGRRWRIDTAALLRQFGIAD